VTLSTAANLHFYFDPVCPFAWMTSKWVRMVAGQRAYSVDWRFISLRLVNADVDYDSHFPPEYEAHSGLASSTQTPSRTASTTAVSTSEAPERS
jgi:predicted DsbA family dithiol-disulfide isomerase